MKDLAKSARKVIDAIDNPGPDRRYHIQKIAELRETWPTLYSAILELAIAVEKQKEGK